MGQKTNPIGYRLGITKNWNTTWFVSKKREYAANVLADWKLRKYLMEKLANAAVASIAIERSPLLVSVTIETARPGMIIGRGGTGAEELKRAIEKIVKKKVSLTINEVKNPELSAVLVARNITEQIEKRIPYKRAIKAAIDAAMKAKAQGIKITAKGRLGGAEIGREETFSAGSVPLSTLRANVDYAESRAHTTYGYVGIKVWIYLGEVPELTFAPKQEEV